MVKEEEKTFDDHIKTIKDIVSEIRNCVNPHELANMRLDLAGWKVWLGVQKIEYKLAYCSELNRIMRAKDLPAAKARIEAEDTDLYKKHALIDQLYNDVKTVISAAATKLKVLSDERYQPR